MLDPHTSENIIESLRFGIPPTDHVGAFTVGRESVLRDVSRALREHSGDTGESFLVKANYGSGKSHILRVIGEIAHEEGYATSSVIVNSTDGVRFNRMDTIMGAIARGLRLPGCKTSGIRSLFNRYMQAGRSDLPSDVRRTRDRISGGGRWRRPEVLKSEGVYTALRAWVHDDAGASSDLVEDWLHYPDQYRGQRKRLYECLVDDLRGEFMDPRAEWMFYAEETFLFHTGGHRQAWEALNDFDVIAQASGLKGLVLLFDEFEDVIQNLRRRDYQQQAFENLFRFFRGQRFPGLTYFAVTPDFVNKCKEELLSKGVYDFDYDEFDLLPSKEIAPIGKKDFLSLAHKIRSVHGAAYTWDAPYGLPDRELEELADALFSVYSPDLVRRSVQKVVEVLDGRMENVP